jgi:hypothetical protein
VSVNGEKCCLGRMLTHRFSLCSRSVDQLKKGTSLDQGAFEEVGKLILCSLKAFEPGSKGSNFDSQNHMIYDEICFFLSCNSNVVPLYHWMSSEIEKQYDYPKYLNHKVDIYLKRFISSK